MTGQIFFESSLTQTDPLVLDAIEREYHRQNDQIELIASENIVSKAVLEAQGTILTNKYAEGYSGKRYYGGCEHVDVVEDICIDRIKKLFNASFANVQVHSGSQANQAVFLALLKPGDTIIVKPGIYRERVIPIKSGYRNSPITYKSLEKNNLLTIRAAENVVRILPPLNVKKSEVDKALKIIDKVCADYN